MVDPAPGPATRRAVTGRYVRQSILALVSCVSCTASHDANPTTRLDGSAGGRASGGAPSAGGGSGATGSGSGGTGNGGGAAGGSGAAGAADGGSGRSGSGGSSGGGTDGSAPLPKTALVFVGSGAYGGASGALSLFHFDYGTAALSPDGVTLVGGLQSFLAFDTGRSALYAADEGDGKLRRLGLDKTTWMLATPTSVQTAGHPVFVTTTKSGDFALVAHYNEGKVESFPTAAGTPGAAVSSAAPGAQAHAIVLSPDERFAFVPCKGADRIARFSFDSVKGTLTLLAPPVTTQSGDGPRHLAFSPDGARAFVVNELSCTVLAYDYDAGAGTLTLVDRVSSLPSGFSGASTGAEILVAPSGRFVYATNRNAGTDGSIAAFQVGLDGHLGLVGHQSTGGPMPRSAAIDPTGRFVFAGNQDATTLAILAVDAQTGALGPPLVRDVGKGPYFVGVVKVPE